MSALRLASVLGVRWVGAGSALPHDLEGDGAVWTNPELWRRVFGEAWREELARRGWASDHPEVAWGVRTRHVGTSGGGVALAALAARRALIDANLSANEVDLLVVGTSTPSRISSSMASAVGKELCTDAACFDVRAGGASGLLAWVQAALAIRQGARVALVVGVDVVPDFLEPDDVVNRALFSSAASALVLRDGVQGGIVACASGRADGMGRAFTIPGDLPPREGGLYTFERGDGRYLESLAAAWRTARQELMGFGEAGSRRLIPYAVTRDQLEGLEHALSRTAPGAHDYLRDFGCTGAASLLHQLGLARAATGLRQGDEVDLIAVGGGIHWACLRWRV